MTLFLLFTACKSGGDSGTTVDDTDSDTELDSATDTETDRGSDSDTSTDTSTDTSSDSDSATSAPVSCVGTGSSNLSGVCLWFEETELSLTMDEAGAGVAIPYKLVIEEELSDVVPEAQDAGRCQVPGPGLLIVHEVLDGAAQRYCLCDSGLCVGTPIPALTLVPGEFDLSFDWNGLNWSGPSDTSNPYGPPFPPGDYTLTVSAVGTVGGVDFAVENYLAVTLNP